MGSGFAGEFHLRSYSCLFAKLVVQMSLAWTSEQDGLIRFRNESGCLKINRRMTGLLEVTQSMECLWKCE